MKRIGLELNGVKNGEALMSALILNKNTTNKSWESEALKTKPCSSK
jgi:hypothetical protein